MKQVARLMDRKELRANMFRVFGKNATALPEEMQEILMDDLVTAFQSRMIVLSRVQQKRGLKS